MRASSAVAASRASTTSTATSQRSIWLRAIAAETCSARVSIARRRRMPAVSTSTYSRPPNENAVSIGSRVVPGWSWTSTRSSPSRQLTSDDLPTLGLPTKAMRIGRSSSSRRGGGRGAGGRGRRHLGQPLHHRVQELADAAAVARRHREDVGEAERKCLAGGGRHPRCRPCSRRPAPACPPCAAAWRPRRRRRSRPRARRRRTPRRRPRRARAASAGAWPPGCPSRADRGRPCRRRGSGPGPTRTRRSGDRA